MIDVKQMNLKLEAFISFVSAKLANYPRLSVGEKIAYPAVGTGFVLMLVSMVLFIL